MPRQRTRPQHPRLRLVGLATLIGVLAAACGDDTAVADPAAPADTGPPVVSIVAADYLLDTPTEAVPPGVVTLELTNNGDDFHHLQLWRVEDAESAADAIRAGDMSPLVSGWAVGGVGAIEGRGTIGTVLSHVQPGEYVAFCLIHTPAGAHNELGMVATLEVAGDPLIGDLPEVEHELVISPTGFELPAGWDGTASLAVVNHSLFPADAEFLRLSPGATRDDFLAFMDGSVAGPPPFTVAGGVSGLRSDATSIVLDGLPSGDYLVASFSPDPLAEMAPQFATGHLTELTIP